MEKYLWEGKTKLLAVYDGNDNLVMRFMYADARAPLAMTKGGLNYYLCYDQVGSLRLVTDTFGNVVKEIDYDSFGNVLADSDPSFTVPFGFAGGLCDVDTQLVHFGARDYDPDTGMWTAKDPILFKGGDTNLFGYVLNDPVNLIDPSGKFLSILGGAIGGGIAGGLAGGVVGAISSYLGGGSGSDIINSAIVGAATGAIVGGVAGGLAGAGIVGPLGLAASDFWAGLDAGLGVGEESALTSYFGALAGGISSIFTGHKETSDPAMHPCR